MASAFGQLYTRCLRGSLFPKTSSFQYYTQVRHVLRRASVASPESNLAVHNLGSTQVGIQRIQTNAYSDLLAKDLTTDVKHVVSGTQSTKVDFVKSEPSSDLSIDVQNQMYPEFDDTYEVSALQEISDEEAVSITVPASLPPVSTSLRAYVDQSETLTKLVQLGVNLWKLEQRPNAATMLLKLDFDQDVTPRLLFLKEIGVEDSRLGHIITHNPFFLSENLENLKARVSFLKSKKFSSKSVASMVSKAPYLLNFSVKRLDNRLGFYQQQLKLSAANTRDITSRLPRLLCGSLEPVKENLKVLQIEFGFKDNEIQHMVLAIPKMLTANKRKITYIFDFLHNTMKVPHHLIVKFPQVFNASLLRLRQRHWFLEYLQKAQYDPTMPNYISLDRLVSLPDEMFCSELAFATLEDFYLFQKTL